MFIRLAVSLAICTVLWILLSPKCQAVQPELSEKIHVDFNEKLSIRNFFANKSLKQLKSLKHNEDPSIAIYAAWFFFEDQSKYARINQAAKRGTDRLLNTLVQDLVHPSDIEFAGFLSGYLGVDLPEWWRALILDDSYDSAIMLKSFGFVRTFNCYHQDRVSISDMRNNLIKGFIVGTNEQSFEVPWDLEIPQEDVDQLWYHGSIGAFDIVPIFNDRFIYATAHKEMAVSRVYCAGKMGDVIWKSDSSEGASLGGRIPFKHTHVELRFKGNQAILFSSTCCDVFLDIFDIETGRRVGGFSTVKAAESFDLELDD